MVANGYASVADVSKPNYLTVTFSQNLLNKLFKFSGAYNIWYKVNFN